MDNLQTLELKQNKIIFDAELLLRNAERESRGLTPEETKQYDDLLEKQLPSVKQQITKMQNDDTIRGFVKQFEGPDFSSAVGRVTGLVRGKSLGQQFIESAVGKWLAETKGTRSGAWRSPSIELKATLAEGGVGGFVPAPDYLPVLPLPQRPIVMSELFAKGPTSSNALSYMAEQTFGNAAAPVLEGGVKPESSITFAAVTEPVRKIAHWLPVTEELLEDEPAMASYIDSRLRLGVLLALDAQLLNGTGVAPQLLGLLVRSDLTPALPMGTDTAVDAIAKQIAAVEAASQLPVDGIVMNGADWLKAGLSKTSTGEYLGSNPFQTPIAPTLWGRQVALTPGIPAGTALVGAFKTGGGQIFERGGLRVEASNSHVDFFVKNLVAVRAEVRVAFAVFRPSAFGTVTGI